MRAQLGLGLAAVGRPAYLTLGRDDDLPADRSPAVLQARSHELLDAAHEWQDAAFGVLTKDWTVQERAEFRRAMRRLLDRSADLNARP